MNKRAQGFNTAAQNSNPGSLSRESETLPLSHCGLRVIHLFIYFMLFQHGIYNRNLIIVLHFRLELILG